MAHPAPQDPLKDVRLFVAEHVGSLMEFWGFKRVLGRIWTVLYLSERPLTAAEIGRRLALSPSAISVALAELKRWGVVHEAVVLSTRTRRAQSWRAESDVWGMVSNVLRQRELPMVRRTEEVIRTALEALADAPQDAETRHLRQAMRSLLLLAGAGRAMLETLLSTGRASAEALKKFPA
ncbi:MAG: MarR family transcriptional regulator [Deltaproteobacteria bacterium]|nr:MarR family transcriptional regulator [Deltaproteobacteria bacterium]